MTQQWDHSQCKCSRTLASRDNVPNIVSNFQDLSPVLSLLASDSVEDKLMDPRAAVWEHMSSMWSLFGVIGAVRAYLKVGAGLAKAEAAGVKLCGGGVYTAKKTKNALLTWAVGPEHERVLGTPQSWWQDNHGQLLGSFEARSSPWQRPHVITVGYSQCPFEGRQALRESAEFCAWVIITLICATMPVIALKPEIVASFYWPATLTLSVASSFVAGCLLPLLLVALNPIGLTRLRHVKVIRFIHGGALRSRDAVITSKADKTSYIIWQGPGEQPWSRSGDNWIIRALAMVAMLTIVFYYCFNYILLGAVDSQRSYVWLGVQVAILVLRYVLWAIKPRITQRRGLTILYILAGSIVPALEAGETQTSLSTALSTASTSSEHTPFSSRSCHIVRLISLEVVRYAVASAGSRLHNEGGVTGNLSLAALEKLVGCVPADILRAEYCDVARLVTELPGLRASLCVIRLPWSFMEEMYTAHGLLLGHNPWALGGLYLAAVIFDSHKFAGLITVHPVEVSARARIGYAGVTCDGACISSLVDGDVRDVLAPAHETARWHTQFRQNVAACRDAAVPNGPAHCEIHVQNVGQGRYGRSHRSRTEPSLADALHFVDRAVQTELFKNHATCGDHCDVVEFGPYCSFSTKVSSRVTLLWPSRVILA